MGSGSAPLRSSLRPREKGRAGKWKLEGFIGKRRSLLKNRDKTVTTASGAKASGKKGHISRLGEKESVVQSVQALVGTRKQERFLSNKSFVLGGKNQRSLYGLWRAIGGPSWTIPANSWGVNLCNRGWLKEAPRYHRREDRGGGRRLMGGKWAEDIDWKGTEFTGKSGGNLYIRGGLNLRWWDIGGGSEKMGKTVKGSGGRKMGYGGGEDLEKPSET